MRKLMSVMVLAVSWLMVGTSEIASQQPLDDPWVKLVEVKQVDGKITVTVDYEIDTGTDDVDIVVLDSSSNTVHQDMLVVPLAQGRQDFTPFSVPPGSYSLVVYVWRGGSAVGMGDSATLLVTP